MAQVRSARAINRAEKTKIARYLLYLLVLGGLTPVLQPLDKCINKPFKNKVRSQYQAWMVNGPFTYTLSGKKRAPSKELVLQWIHKAWQEITADLRSRSRYVHAAIPHVVAFRKSVSTIIRQIVQYSIISSFFG